MMLTLLSHRRAGMIVFALALCTAGVSERSVAQDDSDLYLSGTIGLVSDLRDRGLSLSGQDFAPTASLFLEHDSGFYAGVFAATGLETPLDNDTEIETYVGYAFALESGYVIDLSAEVDSFFGGERDAFAEFKAAVSRDFGLAFIKLSAAYAPDGRWFTPDRESFYLRTDLELPVPGLPEATVITRVGHDIRKSRADVTDWGVGISYFLGDVELSLFVEDSSQDGRFGETNVIGGVRLFF